MDSITNELSVFKEKPEIQIFIWNLFFSVGSIIMIILIIYSVHMKQVMSVGWICLWMASLWLLLDLPSQRRTVSMVLLSHKPLNLILFLNRNKWLEDRGHIGLYQVCSVFVGWFVLPWNSSSTNLIVLSQVNSQRNNCYIYKNEGTQSVYYILMDLVLTYLKRSPKSIP